MEDQLIFCNPVSIVGLNATGGKILEVKKTHQDACAPGRAVLHKVYLYTVRKVASTNP